MNETISIADETAGANQDPNRVDAYDISLEQDVASKMRIISQESKIKKIDNSSTGAFFQLSMKPKDVRNQNNTTTERRLISQSPNNLQASYQQSQSSHSQLGLQLSQSRIGRTVYG